MTLAVRAVFWVMAYLGVVVAPLVFAAIGASDPDHGFGTNFSVALGLVGLAMMGLGFVLVARFKPVASPFGQDALLQFHRQIGYVGLVFVLVHVAISARWESLTFGTPLRRWCGSGWRPCCLSLRWWSRRFGGGSCGSLTSGGTLPTPRWPWLQLVERSGMSTSSTNM
jgi:predicted ferric reductase